MHGRARSPSGRDRYSAGGSPARTRRSAREPDGSIPMPRAFAANGSRTPMLVAAPGRDEPGAGHRPSRRPVLLAIARRSLPHLAEATVVPAAVFYLALVAVGARAAMVAALVWTYAAVARRRVG